MQHCPIKLFRRRGVTLVEVLVSLSVIGLLLALLLPAVQSSREAARKMNCLSNVKQIALGALNYESIFGYFPSSGGLDQPSFLVKVLPQIDQGPHFFIVLISMARWQASRCWRAVARTCFFVHPTVSLRTISCFAAMVEMSDGTNRSPRTRRRKSLRRV